ncbi:hypothetical protein QA601_00910 [Chitinispirillales bacterium ANBcel5]|uniref:hypothetical protein n=1 Tax=Cellulosispirillum alkaliphilum TaxID=3039283 RepID=UPI002A5629B3|nr:hypothetical protein [Chitinispirillales bacterium ANBcel5]
MIQYVLTPSAGKRLIGKAVAERITKSKAIKSATIAIIAGTTNGYIAEELLLNLGQSEDFCRKRFFRGITPSPGITTTKSGRFPDESQFPGDVIIQNGTWLKGKTIYDIKGNLQTGDIIIKGANCVNLCSKKAGVLIGHPEGGTIIAALQANIGKRVELIIPVGLEKRVCDDIDSIALSLNSPKATGPRLIPVTGNIITELQAIHYLSGCNANLVSAGGVLGAEGAVWIAIEGNDRQLKQAKQLLDSVIEEPLFAI